MTPTSPIRFAYRLEVQKRGSSPPRILVVRGDSVSNGDRIQAVITPEEDVYLYLGYCDGRKLALFPPQGSLQVAAGVETRIPPGHGAFEISGDAASEVLYLILSKTELSLASPELAVRIARSGAATDGDCAGPLRDAKGEPIPAQQPVDVRVANRAVEVVRYLLVHRSAR